MTDAKYKPPRNHAEADALASALGITFEGKPTIKEKKAILAEAAKAAIAAGIDVPDPAIAAAPFGWNVVGEDGRRIARSLPKSDAQAEAARIAAITGETISVVAAEVGAPSVAIAAAAE